MAEFDLYEFPADHIGRKTYVHVEGHKRSVPKIYTYRGSDGRNYVHPDFGGTWDGAQIGSAPTIMPDKLAYVSPVDGTHVTSRSHHREHMRRHDLIEVGNERIGNPNIEMPSARNDVRRAISMLRNGYRPEMRGQQ